LIVEDENFNEESYDEENYDEENYETNSMIPDLSQELSNSRKTFYKLVII